MAEYAKSAELAARLDNIHFSSHKSPHPIGTDGIFWYRWEYAPHCSRFVYVNPDKRIRRPAFDHEAVAKTLRRADIEAEATSLPFKDLDFEDEDLTFSFIAGGRRWLHSRDGFVSETCREVPAGALKPLAEERNSKECSISCMLTFVNRLDEDVDLFWIDFDGDASHYFKLCPGQTGTQQTFADHVWRIEKSKTHERVSSFAAIPEDSVIVINQELVGSTNTSQNPTGSKAQQQKGCYVGDRTLLNSLRRRPVTAFVYKHNLWTKLSGGGKKRVSTTGTEEGPFDDTMICTNCEGKFVVAWQMSPKPKNQNFLIQSSPSDQIRPRVKHQEYDRPDDTIRTYRPRLFNVLKGHEIKTDDSLFLNQYCMLHVGWNAEGTEYLFTYEERGWKSFRLLGMDTAGGIRVIIEEKFDTFVDCCSKGKSYYLDGNREVIWSSERDGRNHLYLYDIKTGQMKNRITSGNFNVISIDEVDEEDRRIFMTVVGLVEGQNPYYSSLARINFDGSGLRLLTHGDGGHKWDFIGSSGNFIMDSWSRPDRPTTSVLRDGESGEILLNLEQDSLEDLENLGWTVPERFAAPGRDGKTMIYGIIIVPSHLDPEKKYPVVEDIYAGPQNFHVPTQFGLLKAQHELAELGFIVVMIDGMGTNWRTKAFHDVCHKYLKDAGLPDRIAWMQAAAKTRPWMDLERGVGVYGSSTGGQNALSALLWQPDFYKVAVADSGCHDNRLDKLWWNEQWMGWPVDKFYEESSNVVNAHQLKGRLLLIAGEMDDNVDPMVTLQVANALNKAGKDYELLWIPGAGHCPTQKGSHVKYAQRRMRDFFVKHLIGDEPPDWNNQ